MWHSLIGMRKAQSCTIVARLNPLIRFTSAADGVRIAYYTMGRGHPFVATSALQWSHLDTTLQFKEHYRSNSPGGLGQGLQVVRYDARGTGLSDRGMIDFSLDAQMRDLEAVLGALGLDRFALFGRTHGSPLAISYAAQFPERVTHLVLALPHARGRDLVPMYETLGMNPVPDMTTEQWESYTRTLAHATFNFAHHRHVDALAHSFRESMTPASYSAFLAWRDEVDVTPMLSKLTVPTLILSRRTKSRPPTEMAVAAGIANATVVSSDAPTVPAQWLPEESAAVMEFLGVEPAGAGATDASSVALTPREREVLALVVEGHSNRVIAEMLVLSERTVARHIANMYEKTGAHGRAEITAYALRQKLV